MCTEDICGPMAIHTFHQYCRLTLDRYLIDTPFTLNDELNDACESVDTRPAIGRLLIKCWVGVSIRMPIKHPSRCQSRALIAHSIVNTSSAHDPIIDIYLSASLEIKPWQTSIHCCHNCHCQWFTCPTSFSASSSLSKQISIQNFHLS